MLTPQPVASQTTSAAVAAAAAVTANEDDEDEQEVRNRCALACWTVLFSVFVSSYPHLPSPCLHLGLPPTRHMSFVLSFNFFQVWSRACLGSRSCRSCPLMFLLFSFCFFPPSLVAIYRHLSTLCWAAASPPPHLPASLLPFLSVSFLFLPLSTSSFFSPASQGVKLTHACVNAPPSPAQVAANDGLAVGDKVYAQYGDGGDEYEATIKEITAVGYLLDWADGDSMVRKL
jgi:hypothetical protein